MQKLDLTTTTILRDWISGKQPTGLEQEELIARELVDRVKAHAFGINKDNCQQLIEARSQLFRSVYFDVVQWCDRNKILDQEDKILNLMWNLWLPLAVNLAEIRQKLGRTPIQGILGGQGTGKSTLASILRLLLSHLGYATVNLSLDDIYKTYTERYRLQKTDPRLIWRGPPGTHDVYLGLQVLEQCLQGNGSEPILIPRFDKSVYNGAGDRTQPEVVKKADIVIFEGWFIGVRPVDDAIFDRPLHPILNHKDIQFAKDNNERLKAYLPLWEKIDRLLVLYPTDYHFSKMWRKKAEQNMIASGKPGMSDLEVEDFVTYFWRSLHPELFISPLIKNPDLVNLVLEIDENHNYTKIYRPT